MPDLPIWPLLCKYGKNRICITPWLAEFLLFFLLINFHEPAVKGPTYGVSYLNRSNPLFHVQLTPSLTSFTLEVNFPKTLGSVWFKSYLPQEPQGTKL